MDKDPVPFSPLEVGIIGGKGRMGRWLAEILTRAGHHVRVASRSGPPITPSWVAACQVLVLSVPVGAVEEVMAQVGPHTDPQGLVMDLASLKSQPLACMLAHARGQVVGLHPLCGPWKPSLKGTTVFVCPGRGQRWLTWLGGFLEGQGARVVEMDPAQHDRLMSRAQSLRHLWLHCLGGALMRLEFSSQQARHGGPWMQTLLELLAHQGRQPSDLYADLALDNPFGPEMAQALEESLGETLAALRAGDRQGLTAMMDQVAAFAASIVDPKSAPLAGQ